MTAAGLEKGVPRIWPSRRVRAVAKARMSSASTARMRDRSDTSVPTCACARLCVRDVCVVR